MGDLLRVSDAKEILSYVTVEIMITDGKSFDHLKPEL